MKKRDLALLVGNDINNISNGNSWNDLLQNIVNKLEIGDQIDVGKPTSKPFPLLYEEIFLSALAKRNCSSEKLNNLEKDLKKFISKSVQSIRPNSIHEKIMSLEFEDIMTTNYEYSLQKSLASMERRKEKCHIQETKYSIFRKNRANRTRIWHIHGDCENPNSILLGYEQYVGFLQRMRDYVVTGTNYSTKSKYLKPLKDRLNKPLKNIYSWIDLLFTKDIHIIGLSLDTSEIDLWWLLNYRARLFLQDKINIPQNKIYYYYPSKFKKTSEEKIQLFKSTQVETKEISGEGEKYYNEILDQISKAK